MERPAVAGRVDQGTKMAMTKKEQAAMQAAMQAAIDRAETLAALRWTWPVERDVGVPLQGYSEGWDYNAHAQRVWQGWSSQFNHGEGTAPEAGKYHGGSQGSQRMFSTKALALAAMRHELEKKAADDLMKVDRKIAAEMQASEAVDADNVRANLTKGAADD
jgi:hypothetical protein